MKNPEINIVKKMSDEQKRLLLFAPIGIIILVVSGYVLFYDDASEKEVTKENDQEWNLPGDSEKDLPNSVLAIEDELNSHNNKVNKDSNNDFFDDLSNINSSDSSAENLGDTKNKDSMYLEIQRQLKTLDNKKNVSRKKQNTIPTNTRLNNRERKPSTSSNIASGEENDINLDDFFNKKASNNDNDLVANEISAKTDAIIYAVIHNDQDIKEKDRVVLRLTKPATISDKVYKENTFLYSFANFGKNRVFLSVSNIDQIATNLVAYDVQDGGKGLYIEGANTASEIAKKSTDEGIDESDIDRIPGGKTISNVFKKKNKEAKVYLLNDYEIMLKSN